MTFYHFPALVRISAIASVKGMIYLFRVVAEVCVQAKRYRRSLYKAKRGPTLTKTVQNDTKTGASVPEIQIRGTDASIT